MSDNTQDPASLPQQKYHVLMMTAAVITCDASSEMEAAQRALIEGPRVLDPKQLSWVVKFVSEKEIVLSDGEGESAEETAESESPKLDLIK